MKYCIGCTHLRYDEPVSGYSTEWTADIGKEDAALACKRGYWRHEFSNWAGLEAFEKAMEKAKTCGDYVERPTETDGPRE